MVAGDAVAYSIYNNIPRDGLHYYLIYRYYAVAYRCRFDKTGNVWAHSRLLWLTLEHKIQLSNDI